MSFNIMWSLCNRFLLLFKKKYFPYVFSIIIFFTLVISSYYIIIYRLTYLILEKQITALISALGISFALFQFMINDINSKRRNNQSLKLAAYKEITLNLETLLNVVNIGGATKDRFEAHIQVTNIIMTLNKNMSIIDELIYLNFPEIIKTKYIKEIKSKVSEILSLTNNLREYIDAERLENTFDAFTLFGDDKLPEEINEKKERNCQHEIWDWYENVKLLIDELRLLTREFYQDMRKSLVL